MKFLKYIQKAVFLMLIFFILLIFLSMLFKIAIFLNENSYFRKAQTVYAGKKYNKTNLPSFFISIPQFSALNKKGIIPVFALNDDDAKELYPDYDPDKCKATIALLFGVEDKHFEISGAYVQALLKAGARVRFISFNNKYVQLKDVDAILLTGGNFAIPPEWFSDNEETFYPPCGAGFL